MPTNNLPVGTGSSKTKTQLSSNIKDEFSSLSQDLQKSLAVLYSGDLSKSLTSFVDKLSKTEKAKYDLYESTKELKESTEKLLESGNYSKEQIKAIKEDSENKLNEIQNKYNNNLIDIENEKRQSIKSLMEGTEKVLDKNNQSIKGAILGPLNVLTSPLEQFLGKDFFGDFTKKILFGGKPSKKNPTANDVQKIGVAGAGYLFIANTMTKIWGKGKDEKSKEGFFDSLTENGILKTLSTVMSATVATKWLPKFFQSQGIIGDGKGGVSIGKTLLKGGGFFGKNLTTLGKVTNILGGVGSIGAGVYSGIKDIKSAQNLMWSDKDGQQLSKGAKGFGAFMGGVSKGLEGAFSNLGKWAMIGFGVGNIIFPGLGGLIGGGIGALLGSVLGFIGGEKIAQFGQKIGDWFKNFFTVTIPESWNKVKNKVASAWMKSKEFSKKIGTSVTNFMSSSINAISNSKFVKGTQFVYGNLFDGVKNIFTHMFDNVSWDKDIGVFDNVKNIVTTVFNNIKNGIVDFFENNPLGKIINEWVIEPMKKAFSAVSNIFKFIGSLGWSDIWEIMTTKEHSWGSKYDEFVKSQEVVTIDDAVIKPDGTIVKTNPNDTLVALKDIPTSVNSIVADEKINKQYNNVSLEKKLDVVIDMMTKLLNKEPVKLTLPQQTRYDLDLIMNGRML